MKLSERVNHLSISPTRRYQGLAREMESKGREVLKLSIGQPDLYARDEYFEALANLPHGRVGYPQAVGEDSMRNAQCAYYKRCGISYAPNEIFVTAGATQGIEFTLSSVCDPGDAVMLIEPFYPNYSMITHMLGIEVCAVTARVENNYEVPSEEELEAAYKENIRAMLFSNPGNPTGRVYSRDELQRLVNFAKRHDLFIISDEVYRELNFKDEPFISLYDFEEIRDQLVLIDSASKKYAVCGARIGTLAVKNPDLQLALTKLCQMNLGTSHAEQEAVAALASLDDRYFDGIREIFRERRDELNDGLSRMVDIAFSHPEGAFYTLVKLPVKNAEDFVVWLLKEFSVDNETVLLTPAENFYHTPGAGIDEVRISYCVDKEKLSRAVSILDAALEMYPDRK